MQDTARAATMRVNAEILTNLIQRDQVETEQLMHIVQLMAMPQFNRFFAALCKIDVERVDTTAMGDCLERFVRREFDLDEALAQGGTEIVASETDHLHHAPFCPPTCPMMHDD